MARKAVIDAVEARLAAEWSLCPVQGVNLKGTAPKDGSGFLIVQYPVANEEQISFGAPSQNVWREEGAIRFVINAGRGQGTATGLQWAEEIATLFRGKTFDGVRTFGPSSPPVDDRNDQGNYFTLSVVVTYQHDLFG